MFKNINGAWLTNSLFCTLGFNENNKFTFGQEDVIKDGVTYPSFDKMYMETNDPSEYLISQKLGGWKHWVAISKSAAIKPYLESLREEMAVKLRSQGLQAIIAQSEGVKGYSQARYLADKSWVPNTKVEKVKKSKEQIRIMDEFQDDLDRIGAVGSH